MSYFVIKTVGSTPEYEGTKSLDGVPYKFRFYWNTYTEKWYFDMTSLTDAAVTVRGVALLPGVDNLIARYGWGHLLGQLRLVDTSGAEEPPTFDGMGDRWEFRYYPR